MRDKHGSSEEEIQDALRNFYEDEEELSRERFKCPRCGGRNFNLRIKCTITADIENMEVLDWRISHIFYTTLTCRDCEGGELEDTSFFYDFDELPRSIKSGIFNV